jgi:hypothetical protein
MIPAYGKVWNLGHKAIIDLFKDEVIIQEKIDGSQFSFGIIEGELQCRSHHQSLQLDQPPKLFKEAIEYVVSIQDKLESGLTYRGEVLQKPKHNTLKYDRVPKHNIIIFDIDKGIENYFGYDWVEAHAFLLDLEIVPLLAIIKQNDLDAFKTHHQQNLKELLESESILGGTTIEGVVIKNYHRFGIDGHCLMGKYVSEKFKELNKSNPDHSKRSFIEELTAKYTSEARWEKAVQHLKEQSLLSNEPKDIALLLPEIDRDVMEECGEEIKEALFQYWWREIKRGIAKGFPEWYKNKLAEKQFGG